MDEEEVSLTEFSISINLVTFQHRAEPDEKTDVIQV